MVRYTATTRISPCLLYKLVFLISLKTMNLVTAYTLREKIQKTKYFLSEIRCR